MDIVKQQLIESFRQLHKKDPSHIFFCPGRVNLIGEHIDYNGGKVLPCAIGLGTYLAVSKNTEKVFRFNTLDYPGPVTLHLQQSYTKAGKQWFNYPLGVINEMLHMGSDISGLDMLFAGNLPIGAGLSSSASIEVVTAFAVNELFKNGFSGPELAQLSKKVENEFIGLNCGIMDQFAVAMGRENKAILLDCDTLAHEFIPFEAGDPALIIINTNKQRTLSESKYNERFAECGRALDALKKGIDISNLCEISAAVFNEHKHLITDPVVQKRALHVIMENERVQLAVDALKAGEMNAFGQLMYASHESLRDLYEVSGPELDTIVEFCRSYEGVAGARMTGAGFGGCAIALVQKKKVNEFSSAIMKFYQDRIGYAPGVFVTEAAEGVREI